MAARLRASAALSLGAFCLHQLRYLAGHGDHAGEALAREGHAYLGLAGPVVAVLAALALAQLVLALQRRAAPGRDLGVGRLWALAALSLLAVYVVQESLEGAFAAGHPGGLEGLVGAGGWTAAPLALSLGLGVALLLRCAHALLAARARSYFRFAHPHDAPHPRTRSAPVRSGVLALHLAGRAPPHASC